MTSRDFGKLDLWMRRFGPRLRDDLNLAPAASEHLATTVAGDIAALPSAEREKLRTYSPVSLQERIDELVAFQAWMDLASSLPPHPATVRAQVITQNYISFVYLSESCFRALRAIAPSGSVTRKCAQFLTDNPVRAFRNAISHANWRYNKDFTCLEYWARKGEGRDEPLVQFSVNQTDLTFWQALARCVAYAAFLSADPTAT